MVNIGTRQTRNTSATATTGHTYSTSAISPTFQSETLTESEAAPTANGHESETDSCGALPRDAVHESESEWLTDGPVALQARVREPTTAQRPHM